MLSTKRRTCSEPLDGVGQLTAGRRRRPRSVAGVQGLYHDGDALERSYNPEVEVVTDLAGLLSDGETNGLDSCNAVLSHDVERIVATAHQTLWSDAVVDVDGVQIPGEATVTASQATAGRTDRLPLTKTALHANDW